MDQQAFEDYSARFAQLLSAFDHVVGIVAIGSTADRAERDCWSDHDFGVVLRGGRADRFLNDASWLPQAERIIASARHADMYNVAIYDDGHKVECLVCDEAAVS